MNKTQLIDELVEKTEVAKVTVTAVVNAMLDIIPEKLAAGEKIDLVGFGSYYPKLRAGRTGRDPRTGAPLQILETIVPVFKPGQRLKDAVNQKGNPLKSAKATSKVVEPG